MHPVSMPPLNALKAFESAGRHMSFTEAAKELHVTPAAISHQIKTLESYLGVKLFHRKNRSLELTVAAQACWPGLRKGFDHLGAAIERIQSTAVAEPLLISAPPILVPNGWCRGSLSSQWRTPKCKFESIRYRKSLNSRGQRPTWPSVLVADAIPGSGPSG